MINIKKEKLRSGLRVVLVKRPGFHSVVSGIYFKVGSRYEQKDISGISHFIEHMPFRGTEKYKNKKEIFSPIDSVGGYLNAFTSYDMTGYYHLLPKSHLTTGLDILNQLAFSPLFRKEDIKKEIPIILEEIKMKDDIPEIRNAMDLVEMMGEGSSLSLPILGTEESISAINKEKIEKYRQKYYSPANGVLVIVGDINKKRLLAKIKEIFDLKSDKAPKFKESFKPQQASPRIKLRKRDTDQVKLAFGSYGYGYDDKKEPAWKLLTRILGRGPNSRLFTLLREKNGLCYDIQADQDNLKEIGMQSIVLGLKKENVLKALKLILKELRKIKDEGVKKGELKEAKSGEIGNIDISYDDLSDLNSFFAEEELLIKEDVDLDQLKDKFKAVTLADIKQVTREIYRNDNINLALLGPYDKKAELEKVFKL